MAVKHAVLGLVIERPGYGYSLAQRLQERCGAWGWQRAGVYGALDRLEQEQLVRPRSDQADGAGRSASRTVYEATLDGQEFFREWLLSPCPPTPYRLELDLKLQLCGPEHLPRLAEQAWGQERLCLAEIEALRAPGSQRPGSSWEEVRTMLLRDSEIRLLRARIETLQDVRDSIARLLANAPTVLGGSPAAGRN